MAFCIKEDEHFKEIAEYLGEDKARMLLGATGEDMSPLLKQRLANASLLTKEAIEGDYSQGETEAHMTRNKDITIGIHNAGLNSNTVVDKAIKLLEARKNILYLASVAPGDNKAAANISAQIAVINMDIKEMKDEMSALTVVNATKRLIEWVEKDMSISDSFSATQLVQSGNGLDIANSIIDNLLEFTVKDGKFEYKTSNESVIEVAKDLRARITQQRQNILEQKTRVLWNMSKKLGGSSITAKDLENLPEMSRFKSALGHLEEANSPVLQMAAITLGNMESNAISEASEKYLNKIDKMVKETKAAGFDLGKETTREQLFQEDEKGNSTMNLVMPTVFEFDSLKKQIKKGLFDRLKNKATKITARGSSWERSSEALGDMIIPDPSKLLSENAEVVKAEEDRLVEELGSHLAKIAIADSKRKQKAWESRKERIMEMFLEFKEVGKPGFDSIESLTAKYTEYVDNRDPLLLIDEIVNKRAITTKRGIDNIVYYPSRKCGQTY